MARPPSRSRRRTATETCLAQKKNDSARLADFQYAGAALGARGSRGAASTCALRPRRQAVLARRQGDATRPPSTRSRTELDALQDLFYADRRFKLLVVLQGTDTSGKDGTIRGVFGQTSALGVHTVGWKAPTEDGARARLPLAHPPAGAGGSASS